MSASDMRKTKKELVEELDQLRERLEQHEARDKKRLNRSDALEALLNSIPDTIYFKDLQGRFTLVNKAQAETLGLTRPDEAIGKSDFDFFTPEHARWAYEDEQEVIKSGKPMVTKVEKIKHSSGKYLWVSATKVPLFNKKAEVTGTVGVSRDITQSIEAEQAAKQYLEQISEQKERLEEQNEELTQLNESLMKSERKLNELNATKDKFFSIIAHDLRSPFTALMGYSECLSTETDELTNKQIKTFAMKVHKLAGSAYNLLENLLQWSRMQTGRIQNNPSNFSVKILADMVVDLSLANAQKKSINISNLVPPDLLVYADKNMIEATLRNLVSNAIKFTFEGGSIEISSTVNGSDFAAVKVKDTGRGMKPDIVKKLFNIQEQVTTEGTENEKGTGLGLILCKEFVEHNGGKISVSSKEGKGSVFSFTLPKSH